MNSAPPPLTAEEDPHAITSALEILSILRTLEKNHTLIRLHTTRANSTIVTTLLEILPEQHLLVLDNAPQQSINERLIAAGSAICEATLDNVNIRFGISNIQSYSQGGQPALSAAVPDRLSRVQRRDSYRISTPVANPVQCRIPLDEQVITLALDDISTSGIGAFDDEQRLDASPGKLYRNCMLDLPGSGVINVDLRVAYACEYLTLSGKTRQRIGFAFERPGGAVYITVQRYVSRLERELIAKRKGFA